MSDTDSTVLLTTNLTTKEVTLGDGAWVPPVFLFGSQLTLAFRIVEQRGATVIEPPYDIATTFAAVGSIDRPPTSRHFSLQIGEGASTADNTTEPIQYNATPEQVAEAINALADVVEAYGEAAVEEENGSWVIVFGDGALEVPMQLRKNKLRPVSLLEVTALEIAGEWEHELRLMQAPVAIGSVGERVLPPAPEVTRVDAGGSGGDGSNPHPEVQELYVPTAYRGSYYLEHSTGARTAPIAQGATTDEIEAALVVILGTGNVKVTAVDDTHARIAFIGDLNGIAWDVLEVTPVGFPAGDLTLTLTFDRAELLKRLRTDTTAEQPLLVLPLHVRMWVTDEDDNETPRDLLLQNIAFRRPLIWPALETVPGIDYVHPLSPRDYKAFSRDTVIEGHKWYPEVLGDGVLEQFDLTHGLATEAVVVFVRENISNGYQLVNGTDYRVRITNADSVRVISLVGAPAEDGWAALVLSAQVATAFVNGLTVTEGQVTDLDDDLDDLRARLTVVEAQAATTPLGVVSDTTASDPIRIEIPNKEDAYPVVGGRIERVGGIINLDTLPRPGWLLPAIHDAAVTSVTTLAGMPSIAAAAGNVYSNDTGAAITLDGGGGWRASSVAVGGFFGGDGRLLYPLTHALDPTGTSSYFARGFERLLFAFVLPSEVMRASTMLALQCKLATQIFKQTSDLQYLAVIEHGTTTATASPGTPAVNLAAVTWEPVPLLTTRLVFADNKTTWPLGVEVIRHSNGDMAANQIKYGKRYAAGSVPVVGDLAIRGRLINADTENAVTDAVGIPFWQLSEALATITNQ